MISFFFSKDRKGFQNQDDQKGIYYENCHFKTDYQLRFAGDQVRMDSDDYILMLEGIVLNKKYLLSDPLQNWHECLIELYKTKGELFFSQLRGSFVGVLFDKAKKRGVIFRDQLGRRPLYYSNEGKWGG